LPKLGNGRLLIKLNHNDQGGQMAPLRNGCHLVTLILGCIFATSALPADAPAPPRAVQAAIDCRKLADDAARLACYDKAVDALGQALNKGQVVAVDHAQVQQVRRQAFGFTVPSLSLFDRGAKPEEIDEVQLTVQSAHQTLDGKWIIELEGGQVWRQIDTGDFSRDPKPGAKATIKKAMLGSYMMMIGGHSPVRVHRDQ
jgi:hypothetical protein